MALPILLQGLIGQGFNLLAGAVAAKGKDLIQDKLGIDIEEALGTEEGRMQLRQMELDHEEFLVTSAMERDKLEHSNTADARSMNAALQTSENASWLSKNFSYVLDAIIVLGTVILAYVIFFSEIPLGNRDMAFAAFGSMMTLCGTVMNFHRGSSAGSASKNTMMEDMIGKLGSSK